MARDDGYDDRPKLSFSERDKRRGKGRTQSGGDSPGQRAKLESSASYGRFKSAAEAFFSGASMPDTLADKVDPGGAGRARRDALAKLKTAEDPKLFSTLASAYVAEHGPIDDPYLLERLLSVPDEALVLAAIERIGQLVDAGEFKPPKALPQRLKSLELGSDSDDVQDAARALGARLKALSSR